MKFKKLLLWLAWGVCILFGIELFFTGGSYMPEGTLGRLLGLALMLVYFLATAIPTLGMLIFQYKNRRILILRKEYYGVWLQCTASYLISNVVFSILPELFRKNPRWGNEGLFVAIAMWGAALLWFFLLVLFFEFMRWRVIRKKENSQF